MSIKTELVSYGDDRSLILLLNLQILILLLLQKTLSKKLPNYLDKRRQAVCKMIDNL